MMNKKAISEVIGYVLLIVVGISIASIVGVWLRYQVPEDNSQKLCPDDASIVIVDYNCSVSPTNVRSINITLKNKGYFSIDGFTLKFSDTAGGKIGIYNLGNKSDDANSIWGKKLVPEEVYNFDYSLYNNAFDENGQALHVAGLDRRNNIYLLEVQPFKVYKNERFFCEKVSYQEINKLNCH